jgi:hypothetical protein
MPEKHGIERLTKQTLAALKMAHELNPKNYEELVAFKELDPKPLGPSPFSPTSSSGSPPPGKIPSSILSPSEGRTEFRIQ